MMNMNQVINGMKECYQLEPCERYPHGINMLQHGQMVNDIYHKITDALIKDIEIPDIKIPECVLLNKDLVLSCQLPTAIVSTYMIFHDCGKPYCKTTDEQGHHFYGHAEKSAEIWRLSNPFSEDNEKIARLIGMDMDIHTLKAVQVEEFSSRAEALTLLLVGISEINANASIFGGTDSVSFKIKYKQLEKRGKQIINIIKERKNNDDEY